MNMLYAHMDPPTPWITWAIGLWNARLNQNLLHTATSPFATEGRKISHKMAYTIFWYGRWSYVFRLYYWQFDSYLGS